MIVILTKEQMLQAWRKRAGLEPSVSSCSIERFDGIDINSRLETMMRQWYLELLDGGDAALLGRPLDAQPLISIQIDPDSPVGLLSCDESVRRLCSLRLSGWERAAIVVDSEDISRKISLQSNPFSRCGSASPLAWRDPCGSIYATPAPAGSEVTEALAYLDTGPETYRIDERALSTIPSPIKLF